MDAYYVTYNGPEPVDIFFRDVNLKASIHVFRELLSPSGSDPKDLRDMATFYSDMQIQERRKGGLVFRRSGHSYKLRCY